MPMLHSFPREENFVTSRGSKFLRVNLSERLLLVSAAIRRGYTLSPLRLQDYKRDYHLLQRNASMLESIFVKINIVALTRCVNNWRLLKLLIINVIFIMIGFFDFIKSCEINKNLLLNFTTLFSYNSMPTSLKNRYINSQLASCAFLKTLYVGSICLRSL